jgi:hypothetical protein
LRAEGVKSTNFDQIWEELLIERADTHIATRRRLEALLAFDPDEANPALIDQLCADAAQLGQDAIQEIAADHKNHNVPTAVQLEELARRYGSATRPADLVQLARFEHPRDQVPWRLGSDAARALREQEKLGQGPLLNDRLAQLSGISPTTLQERLEGAEFAFSIDDETGQAGRVVLRSRYEQGRRFEVARLLGDRLTSGLAERLLPATRAYTYRQKVQRAFAAELLCPFEALEEKLAGDLSADAREDAARYFNVSERAVTTVLVNNHRLDRDYLEYVEELAV